jgi:short subunit dehydrogenase-like uncharacterized protein
MGYTGRMASAHSKSIGLDFAVAGRTETKLKDLTSRLGVSYYVFDLNDNVILDSILKDTVVILNCAGPYIRTAKPLMEACIRNDTYYLDISAKIKSYQQAQQYDNAAQKGLGVVGASPCWVVSLVMLSIKSKILKQSISPSMWLAQCRGDLPSVHRI